MSEDMYSWHCQKCGWETWIGEYSDPQESPHLVEHDCKPNPAYIAKSVRHLWKALGNHLDMLEEALNG